MVASPVLVRVHVMLMTASGVSVRGSKSLTSICTGRSESEVSSVAVAGAAAGTGPAGAAQAGGPTRGAGGEPNATRGGSSARPGPALAPPGRPPGPRFG